MLGMSLAVLNYGLAMPESRLCPFYKWHGQAKIELGRATHKVQQQVISYAPKPALCDSP